MIESDNFTEYASAEKASADVINEQFNLIMEYPYLKEFLDAVPEVYLVLNEQRQIVFANEAMLKYSGADKLDILLGNRPGEALGCKHAFRNKGGCGTSEFCKTCGAVNAILSSIEGKEDTQECRIEDRHNGESADYRVWTKPYQIDEHHFSIFTLSDISHEKRRLALERIFFHDIMNTAGGIRGFAELLKSPEFGDNEEFKDVIYGLSVRLIEEINAQRDLTLAETSELTVNKKKIQTLQILNDLMELYSNHVIANDRIIVISPSAEDIAFESDPVLIRRIVGNMVKNALEAAWVNQTVTMSCRRLDEKHVEFSVHNPTYMPREIQLQIFQRSFSTKGSGRGLGTYSMKLLTEKYLKGKISFKSDEMDGTVFIAHFPI